MTGMQGKHGTVVDQYSTQLRDRGTFSGIFMSLLNVSEHFKQYFNYVNFEIVRRFPTSPFSIKFIEFAYGLAKLSLVRLKNQGVYLPEPNSCHF